MNRCGIVWMSACAMENKDGVGGEWALNHVWKYGLFYGRCWLWLEETVRRYQRKVIECDTLSTLMSGWQVGPEFLYFVSGLFFPKGFSKSLNVLYVTVRVCTSSVALWMSLQPKLKTVPPCFILVHSEPKPLSCVAFCHMSSQPLW